MNTLYFKYAIEVEKTRSITQAAENLYMAQPNLSKAIKELEEQVGFPIFKRSSKGVFPTQLGNDFLSYARNILVQLEKMEALSSFYDSSAQNFAVSVPRVSYIAHAVTGFLSELDAHKSININVRETNSTQVIHNVASGISNIGIIRYEKVYESYFLDYLRDKQLYHEPLWEFEYMAAMSSNNPLAKTDRLLLEDFIDSIEIIYGDTSVPYLTGAASKQSREIKPVTKRIYVYERSSLFDILSGIRQAYVWTSPIPRAMLERYGLVQRICSNSGRPSKDVMIYHKGHEFTELDNRFINKLRKACEEAEKAMRLV